MGEVYRARDTRLRRDVAIKVLPRERASDSDRLRRFETEARAVAALNHPHILSVFDLGRHDGTTYVVLELLEGRPLREVLGEGALPPRKVVEYGIQICRGLAAAHDKSIVHRDLKPENLFVTRDGQIKILDFGLARLMRSAEDDGLPESQLPTATDAGVVMGTAGYMSPEQARGRRADARSDIFALGVVLYEMLAGRKAFSRDSPADTLAAILHEDPADFAPGAVPPGVEGVLRRCLEKSPQERFQSARDVAFALEALSGSTGSVAAHEPAPRQTPWGTLLAVATLLVSASVGAFLVGRSAVDNAVPRYTPINRREGAVGAARLGADGLMVYAGRFGSETADLYRQRLDSPLARPYDLDGAVPVAVRDDEVAVILGDHATLARLPVDGGSPRELLEGVLDADWGPNGDFAVVRMRPDDSRRLEYPIGTVLLEARGQRMLGEIRISPNGRLVAFVDRAKGKTVSSGSIVVVDRGGERRTLSGPWASVTGLAWSPDGDEVWFTAGQGILGQTALHAVDLSGRERMVLRAPGSLALEDIRPDGAVLVTQNRLMSQARGRLAGDERERDLSVTDWTIATSIRPDGSAVALHTVDHSTGEAGAFLWRAGEPLPVRLGDCAFHDLSPDGRWALCLFEEEHGKEMRVLPTGPGEARVLPRGEIEAYQWGWWSPDSRHVVFTAQAAGESTRLFVQDTREGPPRPLTPEGVAYDFPRFKGMSVLSRNQGDPDDPWRLYPLDGSEPEPVPWLGNEDEPVRWSDDGRYLFTYSSPGVPLSLESLDSRTGRGFPVALERIDTRTGQRQPWLDLQPPDSASLVGLLGLAMAADGRHYVYTYIGKPSALTLVTGLH